MPTSGMLSVHLDLGLLVVLCVLTPSDLIYSFIYQIFIVQDITSLLQVCMFWFPRAALTKHYKLSSLKQQKFDSLTVLESGGLKSRGPRGCTPSETLRILLGLFLTSDVA